MEISELTHKRLCELLDYDLSTGIFVWKISTNNRVKAGQIAGYKSTDGYRYIRLLKARYLEHRLAWFYVNKTWPSGELDHINWNRSDNRIANLRDVTSSQNKQNVAIKKNNTSGYRGVSFEKKRNKWVAYITINYKQLNLGGFDTKEEAYKVYLDAAAKLHTHNPVVS